MTPTILDLPPEDYLADQIPGIDGPTLNATTVELICDKSLRHAWQQHPRLNPDYQSAAATQFDVGQAAHDLILRGVENTVVIDAANYQTKAAREARDDARAAGKVPLLEKDFATVKAMAVALAEQMDAAELGHVFGSTLAAAELTHVFDIDGVACRSMIDKPDPTAEIIYDYKTTGGSAHPGKWSRSVLYNGGRDVQPEFYLRAARACYGWTAPRFRYVIQETSPPYAMCVAELSPSALALAARRVDFAVGMWREALKTDSWPGYPAHVVTVDAPAYFDIQWTEFESNRQVAIDLGNEWSRMLLDWPTHGENNGST